MKSSDCREQSAPLGDRMDLLRTMVNDLPVEQDSGITSSRKITVNPALWTPTSTNERKNWV